MGATDSTPEARRRDPPYRCFLLRCWLEEGAGPGGEPAWRFMMQEAGAGGLRRSFACLSNVAAYIDASLAVSAKNAREGTD